MADAVVIGAGPNGLVAANVLADAGWEVLVLEAQPEPGGAVRSAPLTLPGFTHDRFSAFYPLGVGSPHLARLRLEEHGLRWRAAPVALADPLEDGTRGDPLPRPRARPAPPSTSPRAGDGAAWRELMTWWDGIGPRLLAALLDPVPARPRGAPGSRSPWAARAASSASRASACCRSAASPPSASAATLRPGCSPATRCTPTSAPTRRAARSTAWCSPGSGSRSAGRCRRAARAGSPTRSSPACGAGAAGSSAARAWSGSWCAAAAPPACAPATAARPGPGARCWRAPARPSSTSTCSSASTCRRACSPRSGASSTTRGR